VSERKGHPREIREDMKAARRLEWWNIFWTFTYVAALGTAMGSSQAMKTAWIEDMLGLIPPVVFLIAERYEQRSADARFHYGYDRVNGLGYLVAAVALAAVGLFLLKDALGALVAQEHVTVGTTRIMGHDIWLGWFMLAAQAYACIPPAIIGHKELPLAQRLRDKLIHTDALMNKANWQTGVAGFAGITLLGFGLWWGDAVAAAIISASIIWDGWRALKVAIAELNDGVPRELEGGSRAKDAQAIEKALKARFPASRVLLRETGRYIRAEVVGANPPKGFKPNDLEIEDLDCRWRLDSIAFRP
jgi:divalent metal cation (Fe/Co/Zn/Cd) transporter